MTLSRRQLVEQAIRFERPARVPVAFWNCDQAEGGDVLLYHLSLGVEGDGGVQHIKKAIQPSPNTNPCRNERERP